MILCQMLLPWQMLLQYAIVVDIITAEEDVTSSITAKWQMLLPYDVVVDVITLADVVAICYCGRYYNC